MFDLDKGVEFTQYITGKKMMLKRLQSGDTWLCYQHPDGQYVTLRKATDDEVSAVRKSVERRAVFT